MAGIRMAGCTFVEYVQIDRTLFLEHLVCAHFLVIEGDIHSETAHVLNLVVGPCRCDHFETIRLRKLCNDPAQYDVRQVCGRYSLDQNTNAPTAPRIEFDERPRTVEKVMTHTSGSGDEEDISLPSNKSSWGCVDTYQHSPS